MVVELYIKKKWLQVCNNSITSLNRWLNTSGCALRAQTPRL